MGGWLKKDRRKKLHQEPHNSSPILQVTPSSLHKTTSHASIHPSFLLRMKVFSLTFFLMAAAAAVTSAAKSPIEYEQEFAAWLARHSLSFKEPMEYVRRMETYIANDEFIRDHNAHANASFTLGHNEFSHLTFDEFAQMKKGFQMPDGYLQERLQKQQTPALRAGDLDNDAPESVDWVEKGGVTDVKNQGQCGYVLW